jgi:hypothetical protein
MDFNKRYLGPGSSGEVSDNRSLLMDFNKRYPGQGSADEVGDNMLR